MADEKKYSAREAAIAILDKAKEVLHKAEEMDKCGTFTKVHSKAVREGYSEESADKIAGHAKAMDKAEPVGEIHPKEHVEGEEEKPGKRIKHQLDPEKNPKEQAEGNNELAGTTPTQVGQDGKNVPGYDEMEGPLKLAKFIGYMEGKKKALKSKLGKGY